MALSETQPASLLPTDPKFGSMIFGGSTDTWYSGALTSLAKIAGVGAALPTECTTKNAADPGQCIYANESLPFVKTPIFAVQQMPGTWDYQCMYEGIPNGNILQVQCSCHTVNSSGRFEYNHLQKLQTAQKFCNFCNFFK